ncbi:MAG: helix-turn-helix domain-containing protein [Clostridia bacterium]|nr:helix-turn-helix domain-containing protein [Clostridia bacterium]
MSYCIHSFMCEELGLGGGALLVYAVIYSFTKGERGLFYGTQDFLARVCGLSINTVKRALRTLLVAGRVERCCLHTYEGYRCTDVSAYELGTPPPEEPPNDAEEDLPSRAEIEALDTCVPALLAEEARRPKYEFHPVGGRHGIVTMTAEQYRRLLTLVSSEVLHAYVRRLEMLICDHGYRTFSPYKTIKKWIYEDAAV